jgi:hypothetical protein
MSRRRLRRRSYDSIRAGRIDPPVEPEVRVPNSPAAQALRRGDLDEAQFAGYAVSDTLYVGLPRSSHGAGWPSSMNESVRRISVGWMLPLQSA